jgi:hypothetical protein
MEEQVYFHDSKVKVTNLRVVFGNTTVTTDRIERLHSNFKAFTILFVLFCLLLSFGSLFLIQQLGILPILLSFIWLCWVYPHYAELWIISGGSKYRVLCAPVGHNNYIKKVEDAIREAQKDNKLLAELPDMPINQNVDTMIIQRAITKHKRNKEHEERKKQFDFE